MPRRIYTGFTFNEAVAAARSAYRIIEREGHPQAATLDTCMALIIMRTSALHASSPKHGQSITSAFANRDSSALGEISKRLPEGFSIPADTVGDAVAAIDMIPTLYPCPSLPGEIYQNLINLSANDCAASKSKKQLPRHASGSFYTPEEIVWRIISLALERRKIKECTVCDPSMGTGHFLAGAVDRFTDRDMDMDHARTFVTENLFGIDRDPMATRLARVMLWLKLSDRDDEFIPPAQNFVVADTLLTPVHSDGKEKSLADFFPKVFKQGGFDVIVGNPPYDVLTGFKKNPQAKKMAEALRKSGKYELSMDGQINLYRCFIERGLAILKDSGRLGYIVPSGLLMDSRAAKLRKALIREHGANHFETYPESARIFDGVTQALTVFRATKNSKPRKVSIIHDEVGIKIPVEKLRLISDELPLPHLDQTGWRIIEWLGKYASRRFGEACEGFVGEVDQTFFARHMKDVNTGHILLRGCHLRSFHADTTPQESRQRFLDKDSFLAQKKTSAELCMERVNRPRIAQLGIRNMESLPRLVAARIKPGIFLGNSVNFWLPSQEISEYLLLGLLSSGLYDWRFRLTSSNNNINICEVEALPLPKEIDPGAALTVELAAKNCEKLTIKDKDISEAKAALDEAVFDMFNMPKKYRAYVLAH